LLRRALGYDFVKVINRGIQKGVVPKLIQEIHIQAYDELITKGITDAGTLRKLAKAAGIGDFFDVEHIFEQRFWRNNPALAKAVGRELTKKGDVFVTEGYSFDEKTMGFAVLVPKNEAVATRIFEKWGGQRIRYVNQTKRILLDELIPKGAEAYYTTQQIWDAHAHVMRLLDAEDIIMNPRVIDQFNLYAEATGESLVPIMPSKEVFSAQYSWPQVFRSIDRTTLMVMNSLKVAIGTRVRTDE
jgi:hypothetical protein